MEIWKDIKGFEGVYMISNHGRVKSLERTCQSGRAMRSVKERILKSAVDSHGYMFVHLYRAGDKPKMCRIHRAVAEYFIPRVEGKGVVNHLDGNPKNNHVTNLEWTDPSGNTKHAYETGLMKTGSQHHYSKLKEKDVLYIRSAYKAYNKKFGASALGRQFGVSQGAISHIVNGKKWRHLV